MSNTESFAELFDAIKKSGVTSYSMEPGERVKIEINRDGQRVEATMHPDTGYESLVFHTTNLTAVEGLVDDMASVLVALADHWDEEGK